nr:TetR/AcrR family transcriptional regulator [Microbacterium bovistercoris]
MQEETPLPGLRERKREQTRRRLETAAVEIVLEDGLDKLTIDALSERAEVSPRTFFNYFDSKEDAILGVRTQEDTQALVAETLEGMQPTSLLDGVLELLSAVMRGAGRDLHEQRHQIVRAHPELLQRKFSHMDRMLSPLSDGVRALIDRTSGPAQKDAVKKDAAQKDAAPCSDEQAQVVLMTCGAAMRAATIELAREHSHLSTDEATARLRTRAAALVREMTGLLQ